MGRFIVEVEGPGWQTYEVIELPRLPTVGDPIETQYGTLRVAEAVATPEGQYAGKIVCRTDG
jgi:hypothetical protein